MCSLCVTRSGLHGPLWAGAETGALQELATCHPEREKVQTHLLRTERTLHKQWVQFRGRCDVFFFKHHFPCLSRPRFLFMCFYFFDIFLIFLFLSLSLILCCLLIVHLCFRDVTVFVPPLQLSALHHSAPVEHVNHMVAQPQYMRPVHHPLMIHTLNSHMSGKPADI